MAMVRFGQLGQLKPDKIEEYCTLHANPWPGVLKTITECNLRNYSIYLHGDKVFAYFEYVGEDYEADMKKMEQEEIAELTRVETPLVGAYEDTSAPTLNEEDYANLSDVNEEE